MTGRIRRGESDRLLRHRRRVVAGAGVTGAGLLGVSFSSRPGSTRFYFSGLAVAGTWIAGGLSSGPLHLGRVRVDRCQLGRPVVTPVSLGVAAFGGFYGAARLARRVPVLERWLHSVLRYAHEGSPAAVVVMTLVTGAAEEVFFRGALFAAVPAERALAASTGAYVVATAATRNPALIFASAVMGTLFGMQRRATGGIQAPILTHLTWSGLLVRYLPPLFGRPRESGDGGASGAG